MKTENVILDKSFAFAVRIVNLYKYLIKEFKEYELSGQILASGTSIGSNAEEAIGGVSKKDFINKIGISYKEARETLYWIRLLHATKYIDDKLSKSLMDDCEELLKILTSILKSSKE
ncbi:MAG: four helix bundle protein [Bacteroidota bacterium]